MNNLGRSGFSFVGALKAVIAIVVLVALMLFGLNYIGGKEDEYRRSRVPPLQTYETGLGDVITSQDIMRVKLRPGASPAELLKPDDYIVTIALSGNIECIPTVGEPRILLHSELVAIEQTNMLTPIHQGTAEFAKVLREFKEFKKTGNGP